jgi:hypothetical protein
MFHETFLANGLAMNNESAMFPQPWFTSGIVTAASAADFARYSAGDPGKSLRFWRWAAFRDFAEEQSPLPAEVCRAAYHLGKGEADANLGGAIVAHTLYERNCPVDVWDDALTRFPHIAKRISPLRSRPT